ncbi:MAG: NAD(P)H-dependent oxidoreductase [Candidatus Eremiobacteraeota bacterium]|nr:NAD(P)H-dependent oxidoreductase [Candidatus Eremiobacteraeota bacterium]
MKIVILNGSPKGDMSITLQYLRYVEKKIPGHEFKVINIGQKINKIEKDGDYFQSIVDDIKSSDAVIWSFPIYFLMAPSQVKRLVELFIEKVPDGVFKDKYTTAITTSIHFYDHTAHNYIHSVSEDMGAIYVPGYSPGMHDLMEPEKCESLLEFARNFFRHIEKKMPVARVFMPIDYNMPEYKPNDVEEIEKTGDKKVLLLTDSEKSDVNINRMIDVFVKRAPYEVEVLNLNDIDIKGGCIGCIHCGNNGTCIYKDDFMDFFKEKIMKADGIIQACKIKDRYLSSNWKKYYDRSFFNGHRPVLQGKQMGFLISGPLRQIPNLRELLVGFLQVGRVNLVDIITDEYEDSNKITSLISSFADEFAYSMDKGISRPVTFLGVGGHKIFRDYIYEMKFIFREDNLYYEKHGLYDFPQKNVKSRLKNTFLMPLMKISKMREEFYKTAREKMVEPYVKIVEEA